MTASLPTMPPVACTPWCAYGDGHTSERYREDQGCSSGELESPIEGVHRSEGDPERNASWHVEARLDRENDGTDRPVYVAMTIDGGLPQYQMTLLGARALAAHLTLVADQIERAEARR